jgi:hypothetical protein
MSIEEYEKMWAEDCKIDESNLSGQSARIPVLHSKYYKHYHRAALKATKLRYELKELEAAKWEWYGGEMSQEELKIRGWLPYGQKLIKAQIAVKIERDKDIIDLSLKIEYQSSIARFLEDVLKQIHQRNFIIRNEIELLRFQSGIG